MNGLKYHVRVGAGKVKGTAVIASVPGLPRSHMRIYLSACGTRIVAQERGRPGLKYHVRVGSG